MGSVPIGFFPPFFYYFRGESITMDIPLLSFHGVFKQLLNAGAVAEGFQCLAPRHKAFFRTQGSAHPLGNICSYFISL